MQDEGALGVQPRGEAARSVEALARRGVPGAGGENLSVDLALPQAALRGRLGKGARFVLS